jgi:hypothetical protein
MEEQPENPENLQETLAKEPENLQETPAEEPVTSQESPTGESVIGQESPAEELPLSQKKGGRPRKTEEEKKETRRLKYQRAKERKVRVVEPESEEPIPEPIPEPVAIETPRISAMELLQRALSESKEQERRRKEQMYDSWFAHLRRNARP